MFTLKRLTAPLLLLILLVVPAAVVAQEVESDERPDPGFRSLGPRTVVSFVRQTLGAPPEGPTTFPHWDTAVHVSNVGNAPMAAAAIFVSSDAHFRGAARFPVAPGQTVSVTVERIIAQALVDSSGEMTPPTTDASRIITGIVIVRFFAPTDVEHDRFFAQMVTAEQFLDLGPTSPPVIIPLDVERPQPQIPVERRMHDRDR